MRYGSCAVAGRARGHLSPRPGSFGNHARSGKGVRVWAASSRRNTYANLRSTHTMADKKPHIVFFHPDLGIGGAERLVIDAAVGLQNRGHKVTIFTSHCDPRHCFDEARDGKLLAAPYDLPPLIYGRR